MNLWFHIAWWYQDNRPESAICTYLNWELLAIVHIETSDAWLKGLSKVIMKSITNMIKCPLPASPPSVAASWITPFPSWHVPTEQDAVLPVACPFWRFSHFWEAFISLQTPAAASLRSSLISKVVLKCFWKVRSVIPSDLVTLQRISRVCSVWSCSLANACQCAKRNSNSVNRLLVELSSRRPSKTGIAH